MKLVITLLITLASCRATHRQINHAFGGVTGALLVCDYGQTVRYAQDGWMNGSEHNPVLGEKPSVTTLSIYFATILLAGGAASTKLPEWARSSLYSMVFLGQGAMVLGNRYLAEYGTWCGL